MKIKWILGIFAQICMVVSPAFGQHSVNPGEIRVDSTFYNISVLWNIKGDANLNSNFKIEHRPSMGGNWKPGAIPMRVYPKLEVEGEAIGRNYWAGSAMFLKPGTEYELKLTLTDPDGGNITKTIKATTKKKQQPSQSGTKYYVNPGNGGGSGTSADPFKGLQEAVNRAKAGDIFQIAPGTYKPFTIKTSGKPGSPIVFTGPNDKSVVVDGAKTSEGIITIGDHEGSYGYIIIENLTIKNGNWGIDAQNTHHITFRNNLVRDVDWGYTNRRENGVEHDQTISDNIFIGRTSWPASEVPDERGINIIGNNNIVCYNKITYFGDGISTDAEPYKVSYSFDIYGNDISFCVDDLIEVDGTVANTRIWRNRLYNGRMGVSLAPVFGGPCYVFRNELFNIEDGDGSFSTYKMNRSPSGLIIVHNTAVKMGRGITGPSGWQNTYFRNNVLLSTHYVFELYELTPGSKMDDWDYNAYASSRPAGEPWFKWNNVRYANLIKLQADANIESHSLSIAFSDLLSAKLPAKFEAGMVPGDRNLALKSSSKAINSGEVLPNINDLFVTDGSPDCGAFEYGKPKPSYGPRSNK